MKVKVKLKPFLGICAVAGLFTLAVHSHAAKNLNPVVEMSNRTDISCANDECNQFCIDNSKRVSLTVSPQNTPNDSTAVTLNVKDTRPVTVIADSNGYASVTVAGANYGLGVPMETKIVFINGFDSIPGKLSNTMSYAQVVFNDQVHNACKTN